jgi:signal transduction histidine kinase
VLAAVWAVPALLASFQTYTYWRLAGRPRPALLALAAEAPAWVTYALLTPPIFALGRRFPLTRPGTASPRRSRGAAARTVAVHAAAALGAGALYAAAATAATLATGVAPRPLPPARLFINWFLGGLPLAALTYAGVLGAGHALAYLAEARRREAEAARLAAQLAEARLGALRMQLHPHFLYNALNAATVLARGGDAPAAAAVLTRLGGLLRDVLRDDGAHEVALADELAFVRRYLDVEHVRFSDRLRVTFDVEAGALGVAVPRFILQPLVENALRHGIAPCAAGGCVEVGARLEGVRTGEAGRRATGRGARHLALYVRDNGAGVPREWSGTGAYGIGLSNTATRLAALHGEAASLVVVRAPGGGTVATVRFPAHPAPAAGRAAPAEQPTPTDAVPGPTPRGGA